VLGVILLERDGFARSIGLVEPVHFYTEFHAALYELMGRMHEEGYGIDILTTAHRMRREGIHNGPNESTEYTIVSLASDVVSSGHLEDWCLMLRELYIEREMLRIRTTAGTGDGDAITNALAIQELLGNALKINTTNDWRDMSEVMLSLAAHREMVKDKIMLGVPTGIRTLDEITAGLQKTQLVVLAARPSVGKSAFATGIAVHAAQQGHTVGIISLEMPEEQIGGRIAAIYTDIEFWRIYRNIQRDAEEEQRVLDALPNIAGLPIYISDKTSVTGSAIRAKAEMLKRKRGLDLLIIDYLQLIETDNNKSNDNREREVAKLSRSLKKLAMVLQIPIVILCQLNRESEKDGKSKAPRMAQIRESGAIEQDADLVMLLDYPYRRGDTTDEAGESTEGKAFINLEKNRNGETKIIPIAFEPELIKFYEPLSEDPFPAPKPNSPAIQNATRLLFDEDEAAPF
jgi:replicative DNA helicase